MQKLVVHGASLACNHGSKTCKLSTTAASSVTGENRVHGTVHDHVVGVHLQDFGTCGVDGKPCKPITPLPWTVECSLLYLLLGPAISNMSTLVCQRTGAPEIWIEDTDQDSILTGQFVEAVGAFVQHTLVDGMSEFSPVFGTALWASFAAGTTDNSQCREHFAQHPLKCFISPPSESDPPKAPPPPPAPAVSLSTHVKLGLTAAAGAVASGLGAAISGAKDAGGALEGAGEAVGTLGAEIGL